MSAKPLCIDLFCGLGGWSDGFLATGWDCIGFDIEQHAYGDDRYPGQLVIQDVLTLRGDQFRSADCIVASPPCQFFSYVAMPWTRAKTLAAAVRADPARLEKELALFNACFRIQREACEASGRHIPLVVENVRGAQPWVGRARGSFGSYFLWGDVPALMPITKARKVAGFRFDGSGRSFQTAAVNEHIKNEHGGSWFKIGSPGQTAVNNNPDGRQWKRNPVASTSSNSPKRKAASAKIAKIPPVLAHYIGKHYLPR